MEAAKERVEEENSEATPVNEEETEKVENPNEQQMGDVGSKTVQEPTPSASNPESESETQRKEQLEQLEQVERDYSYRLDKDADASKPEHDKENASIDEPQVDDEKKLSGVDEVPESEEKTETHVEAIETAASPLEKPNDDHTACGSVTENVEDTSVEQGDAGKVELETTTAVTSEEDNLKQAETPKEVMDELPMSKETPADVEAKSHPEVTPTKKKEEGRFHNRLKLHPHLQNIFFRPS